jgi:hypothetical protein
LAVAGDGSYGDEIIERGIPRWRSWWSLAKPKLSASQAAAAAASKLFSRLPLLNL